MKFAATFTAAALFAVPMVSEAVVVAYWNFNTLTTSTNNGTSYSPSSGAGSLTVGVAASDNAGTNRGINAFAGTTTNALNSDPSGQALTIQGGALETTTPVQNNGATIVIQVDLTGLENPILSFASQRTGTGFNSNQVAYSTTGSSYTDFGSAYNPGTSFGSTIYSFDFSTIDALDGVATAYFRITLTGATSNAGNNRIDNIQINAVPEPGFALLGSLGILGIFRRRR
ncbi:MAG: PEP-CTERM sorting domain-containing protein [Akkermansiaceae bacterium]|jgi:hypothetical protein|nr:PEP-CTERM sorting domain-containing protein [Akkermansiaceae bacterium]